MNDLYCMGAKPAFFLDYISCGKLNESWYRPVLESIMQWMQTGSALLGGETAEHPGVMPDDDFDLAVVGYALKALSFQGKILRLVILFLPCHPVVYTAMVSLWYANLGQRNKV